jgi:peptide/nickel transport system ATP-binding protein
VFQPCPDHDPELQPVAPDHSAACHLHGVTDVQES